MKSAGFLIILLYLKYAEIQCISTVPVFVIDPDKVLNELEVAPNPFHEISKDSFTYLSKYTEMNSATVIIFVENRLSIEDITNKDSMGTSFYHLRQAMLAHNVKFAPAVREPYAVLNEIFPRKQINQFYMNTKSSNIDILNKNLQYFYIFFEEMDNMTRVEILRQHDLIIREVYFVVKQVLPNPVVAFYTGKDNTVVVERTKHFKPRFSFFEREATFIDAGFLSRIKLGGVFKQDKSGALKMVNIKTKKSVVDADLMWDGIIRVSLFYSDFVLIFQFEFNEDRWYLTKLTHSDNFEDDHVVVPYVSALWGRSYSCVNHVPIVVPFSKSEKYRALIISQYQIQITRDGMTKFGPSVFCAKTFKEDVSFRSLTDYPDIDDIPDALRTSTNKAKGSAPLTEPDMSYNCKYFNSVILSGWFVAILLFSILIIGIVAVMDIETNDRYDDPHGQLVRYCDLHE